MASQSISPLQKTVAIAVFALCLAVWAALWQPTILSEYVLIPNGIFLGAALAYWLLQTWGLWRTQPYLWWYGLGRAFLCAGCFGTVTGFMNVMDNLNRPDMIEIEIPISLYSSLVGLFFYLLCLSLRARHPTSRQEGDLEIEAAFLMSGPFLLLGATFIVLYALKSTGV